MKKIRNSEQIVALGDVASRKLVLEIADRTLDKLDSYRRIRSIMSMEGDVLRIGVRSWDLSKKRNVYLFGAGKACNHMAMAVDHVLGERLTRGIAIVKIHEETDHFSKTEVYIGGHPLPNEEGFRASKQIIEVVDQAGPEDLFIVVISGGSSALMSCPIDGISLQDEIETTDVLLKSGAGIYEINAVRRHISSLNGGMLAKRIQDVGAELIGFSISDAVGSPATGDITVPYAAYKSTPIGPDATTLDDARGTIVNFDVADRLPKSVVRYLMSAGPDKETPKAFPDNTYFLLNTLPDSCIYAKQACEEIGIPAIIVTSFLEGESRDAGTFFASMAREIQTYGNPVKPPCVLLSSGEVTTQILDNSSIKGHGGPGQEMTVSFAITAAKAKGACLLSIDSEGTDGTAKVAGGITDSSSLKAAAAKGISLYQALREHSCFEALSAIDSTVFTGNTGTNLCDLNILYVPAIEEGL
ncbi:glycerate kinase type-2 family protein [Bradyrhizobium sp. Arg314]